MWMTTPGTGAPVASIAAPRISPEPLLWANVGRTLGKLNIATTTRSGTAMAGQFALRRGRLSFSPVILKPPSPVLDQEPEAMRSTYLQCQSHHPLENYAEKIHG